MAFKQEHSHVLLGIDVGTSAVKAAAFDLDGAMLAAAQADYGTRYVSPGFVEQDPDDWWDAVCRAIRDTVSQMPDGAAARIRGMAVSSQAPALVPVGTDGRPVRPALIWMDRRAVNEAREMDEAFGAEAVQRITGNRGDPFYVAPKLVWFRRHEPGLYARTRVFLQVNGYINYRLTGTFSLDHTHSGLLQLIDIRTGVWSRELCEFCGVTPAIFPPISPDHRVIGTVTREAALATGLSEGVPVVAGTVDSAAAAMEAGAIEPGIVAEMTGTSTVLIMPGERAVHQSAFISMPHPLADSRLYLAALVSSGANLRWFRDEFGAGEVALARYTGLDAFDLLTREAASSPPGSGGVLFLPYMMGERSPIWDAKARGVLFGLSLSTPRGAVIRAILEGTAHALLHNVQIARASGMRIAEIRSVGGGSKSPLWNQIKADVLGLPIVLPGSSVGAVFGGAVLAGLGTGLYTDAATVVRDSFRVKERFVPDAEKHRLYREHHEVFRGLYDQLKSSFARLSGMAE